MFLSHIGNLVQLFSVNAEFVLFFFKYCFALSKLVKALNLAVHRVPFLSQKGVCY